MQMRTREDYLRDLALHHVTGATLESKGSSKFFLGSGRKKDRVRLRPMAAGLRVLRGGLSWPVTLTDFTAGRETTCQLALGWEKLGLCGGCNENGHLCVAVSGNHWLAPTCRKLWVILSEVFESL